MNDKINELIIMSKVFLCLFFNNGVNEAVNFVMNGSRNWLRLTDLGIKNVGITTPCHRGKGLGKPYSRIQL